MKTFNVTAGEDVTVSVSNIPEADMTTVQSGTLPRRHSSPIFTL